MNKQQNYGFIKTAAITLPLKVANVAYNTEQTLAFAQQAVNHGAQLLVFPELGLTGYTCGDLFHNRTLLSEALRSLEEIREASRKFKALILVGLPIEIEGKLFNVAAIIHAGKVLGLVPKTYLPNYKEFYEQRWFASGRDLIAKEIILNNEKIPFGTDLLFRASNRPEVILGVEICEDFFVPIPPSTYMALNGATLIANLSASNELVGKADYRRSLVSHQSAQAIVGYVYSSCGVHESTTDIVFSGHCIIGENGSLLAQSKRFIRDGEVITADIDIERLLNDRMHMSSWGEVVHETDKKQFRFVDFELDDLNAPIERYIDPHPFVPANNTERDRRTEEIFNIQAAALAKRLEHTGSKKILIGLSGGLDSTLALLVMVRACNLLNKPVTDIHAYTLPGFGTTSRTKNNALKLAEVLGAHIEEIDIKPGTTQVLKDVGHNLNDDDLTFQNAQARYRTMFLFDKGNHIGGMVIGTGDLSEIALGWSTYNGDHISGYNVNGGVPKTLVRYLVQWVSQQSDFAKVKTILEDILATPISPELTRIQNDTINQHTEDLIGPYELHDFFLYQFIRFNFNPSKILFLAKLAFKEKYDGATLKKWLRIFITRFFGNQWKRSVMTDGPKIGSVSLSPRGDWRMPSDADVAIWLKELDNS